MPTPMLTTRDTTPVGILAGSGSLPGEIADAILARGGQVHIIAIDGEGAHAFPGKTMTRANWGQVGKILSTFRDAGCRDLVVVGGVTRPDLARLRPDWGLFRNLPELIGIVVSGGDDGVLRALIRFIEGKGFRVVSAADVAPELVVGAGMLGAIAPSSTDAQDMLLGSGIVRGLGPFDIGQAVIVSGGRVEAIEAAEGTDRMIARVGTQRVTAHASGPTTQRRGVLVKRPKPGQELRVDLPAIGPATIAHAREAGLAGIAVLAGHTLAAERHALVQQADAAGLFVYGFTENSEPPRSRRDPAWAEASTTVLGACNPGPRLIADARLGAGVLASLASLSDRGSAVISRGYVLGVEPGGDPLTLLARVAGLKQWGEGRFRRRTGVAVLAEAVRLTPQVVAAASHLAAIALIGVRPGLLPHDVVACANQAGIALLGLTPRDPSGRDQP
jgi:UDP-2,3-diacylglucosamine hydrolase